MSSRQVIIILGVLIILLPFLGFNSTWDMVISILTGLLIIILSYRLSPIKENKTKQDEGDKTEITKSQTQNDLPFVENKNESELDNNILN